ncbi:MAG TPA: TIGR01906 family membrane protein [Candidatus Dorea stercoravium]|nr:TIGR01906 family membrane protein [Candidatus Dorea stercoravium]
MKKLHHVLAVAAMLLLVLALLLTSFQLAIYGDPDYRFYEREYAKYNVTESLDMEMEDVMDVTEKMMDYLIGKRPELSVITDVDGQTQDFFNEQDRLHMADVKNLFLGGLTLRWVLLAAAAVLIALLVLLKGDWRRIIPRAYFIALGIFLAATVLLGGLFASDFTKYFTIFHEIFFTNDLWLFDPATDYMIRMLPEGFFYDMVMRIGGCFLGSLVVLLVIFFVWRHFLGKGHRQTKNEKYK